MAIAPELSSLEAMLAVVASITALVGLNFASVMLPPAIALYAAGLVVSVHRDELAAWSIPLATVGLILVYEAGELRHRLPPGAVIEPGPLRALAVRIALTAALGALAAVTVLAAAGLSSRGGASAAIIGGLAVAVSVFLVRMLAPTAQVDP